MKAIFPNLVELNLSDNQLTVLHAMPYQVPLFAACVFRHPKPLSGRVRLDMIGPWFPPTLKDPFFLLPCIVLGFPNHTFGGLRSQNRALC